VAWIRVGAAEFSVAVGANSPGSLGASRADSIQCSWIRKTLVLLSLGKKTPKAMRIVKKHRQPLHWKLAAACAWQKSTVARATPVGERSWPESNVI
jgi:hypothetical protein